MTITIVALRVEVPVTGWKGNRNEKVTEIKEMKFQSFQFCQRVPAHPNLKYKQKAKKNYLSVFLQPSREPGLLHSLLLYEMELFSLFIFGGFSRF